MDILLLEKTFKCLSCLSRMELIYVCGWLARRRTAKPIAVADQSAITDTNCLSCFSDGTTLTAVAAVAIDPKAASTAVVKSTCNLITDLKAERLAIFIACFGNRKYV